MDSVSAPSIFESFNARSLDPAQVAQTFVPSRQFDDLIKRRHTLIVGPRGSGKTTLLKMLQQPALEAWNHPSAESYRERIGFTGVFIPTDIAWSVQLGSLGAAGLDESTRRILSVATFTTHTLRSLLLAFESRLHSMPTNRSPQSQIELSEDEEAELASQLAKVWHLPRATPSLTAIRWKLSERLQELFAIASRENILGEEGRNLRLAAVPYLHLHFLTASGRAVEIYEDLCRIAPGKWALLFDELELAPLWIQEELGRSLRSTDPRFLFKLALNPFTESSSLLQAATPGSQAGGQPLPAAGQDFDQIPLWYVGKIRAYEFCKELWNEMLIQRGLPIRPPEKLLGESYISTRQGDWKDVYRAGSKVALRFSELARKDPSFARFLQRKSLNPNKLDELEDHKRAADVRKIAPIVAVREFYRRPEVENEPKGELRSRKTAVLYSGAESMFAITEGNPRWFIGIMERLLDSYVAKKEKKIAAPWQADQARSAAERFQAMLATIPVPLTKESRIPVGVLDCVDAVASYLHERIVRGPFKSDPPGTFFIDSQVPDEIIASVGRAVNAGAMIYVHAAGPMIMSSLDAIRGKRFRISYLLAPIYGLPLRLGKAIALSTILKGKPQEGDDLDIGSYGPQMTLLGDAEE